MQPYSREYWKSLLPVIQAFVDGKEVECKSNTPTWFDTSRPIFSVDLSYRIKPEEPFRLNTFAEAAEILKAKSEGKCLECRDEKPVWEDSFLLWPAFDTLQYRIKGESK
jgi:hypothetical protein